MTYAQAEAPIFWPHDAKNWLIRKPWCWERLKAGEGDNRGWDGWMASSTWWTEFEPAPGVGKPGILKSMGSQRVGHNWVAELNWNVICHRINLVSVKIKGQKQVASQ